MFLLTGIQTFFKIARNQIYTLEIHDRRSQLYYGNTLIPHFECGWSIEFRIIILFVI